MDKLSVHQNSPKRSRTKKKPIKVVYISNPMRVKATASEFKGVVQELTGRDSDVAELSNKFADVEEEPAAAGHDSGITGGDAVGTSLGAGVHDINLRQRRWGQQQDHDLCRSVGNPTPVNMFDEMVSPKMIEDHVACMPSSLHYHAPPPADDMRPWGDAM